jgi:hypothetical protein
MAKMMATTGKSRCPHAGGGSECVLWYNTTHSQHHSPFTSPRLQHELVWLVVVRLSSDDTARLFDIFFSYHRCGHLLCHAVCEGVCVSTHTRQPRMQRCTPAHTHTLLFHNNHTLAQYTHGTQEAIESNLAYDNEKGIMAVRLHPPCLTSAHARTHTHARAPFSFLLTTLSHCICPGAFYVDSSRKRLSGHVAGTAHSLPDA